MSNFNVGIVFNAIDRASPVLGGVMSNLRRSFSTPTNATIGVNDRATPAIGGIMSRLKRAMEVPKIKIGIDMESLENFSEVSDLISGIGESMYEVNKEFSNTMTLSKIWKANSNTIFGLGEEVKNIGLDAESVKGMMNGLHYETMKAKVTWQREHKLEDDTKDIYNDLDFSAVDKRFTKQMSAENKFLTFTKMNSEERFKLLTDTALKAKGKEYEKTLVAVGGILGDESMAMIDLLKMKGLSVDGLTKKAEKLNFMDSLGENGMSKFSSSFGDIFQATKSLTARTSGLFGEAMNNTIVSWTNYLTTNKQQVLQTSKEIVGSLSNIFGAITDTIGVIGRGIDFNVTAFGGWSAVSPILLSVGATLFPIAGAIGGIVFAVSDLKKAFNGADSVIKNFFLNNFGIDIVTTLQSVGGGIRTFVQEHKELFASITSIGVALSGAFAVFTVGKVLGLGQAIGFVSSSVMWLSRALITNPIGLILLAIAGAGYLIYTNWDKISGVLSDVSSWFSTLWNDMKKIEILGFKPFEALENGLSSLKKSALEAWDEVSKVFNFTNKSDESSVSIDKSDTQAPKFRVQAPQEHGIFRSVGNGASGLWDDATKGWSEFTSGFAEGFDISSIKKDLEPLFTLFKTLESDFEPIGKKLGEHFETLGKHLDKLKSSALDAWGEVKKFFGTEDKKATTSKVAKPRVQKVEIKTKGFFESISAGMTLNGIGKGIGTAFNLASRAISIGLGYVSKILLSLRNGAINAFNAISLGISKAGANIQSVWNGVFNWFSSKFAWLSGIFNRVSNFASSIASMGSNLLATPAPVMVGSGYQKALNNSSVVTRNIVRNPPSSVKNRSSVTNQNHYATTVHISNPANGFDIQKQVLKALKAHSEKNKNTSIKGR